MKKTKCDYLYLAKILMTLLLLSMNLETIIFAEPEVFSDETISTDSATRKARHDDATADFETEATLERERKTETPDDSSFFSGWSISGAFVQTGVEIKIEWKDGSGQTRDGEYIRVKPTSTVYGNSVHYENSYSFGVAGKDNYLWRGFGYYFRAELFEIKTNIEEHSGGVSLDKLGLDGKTWIESQTLVFIPAFFYALRFFDDNMIFKFGIGYGIAHHSIEGKRLKEIVYHTQGNFFNSEIDEYKMSTISSAKTLLLYFKFWYLFAQFDNINTEFEGGPIKSADPHTNRRIFGFQYTF